MSNPTHFSADNVAYKDDILELDGNVKLEHPLGTLLAEHANVVRKNNNSFSPEFLYATLERSVRLLLPFEGEINCDKASIDFLNKHIHLSATDKVLFHDPRGDIFAESVSINAAEKILTLFKPSGKLQNTFSLAITKDAVLSADIAQWDYKNNTLTLFANSLFQEPDNYKIISVGNVIIHNFIQDRSLAISHIETTGPTSFIKEGEIRIECDGKLLFDKLTGELTSLDANAPIKFIRSQMSICAEKAALTYLENKPTSISFFGNVKINNEGIVGVADRINYYVQEKRVELLANGEGKVLFWNTNKSLQMSAHQLLIEKDPKSGSDMIRGVGKVQFSFEDAEKNELLKLLGQS